MIDIDMISFIGCVSLWVLMLAGTAVAAIWIIEWRNHKLEMRNREPKP